jgi:hypothetical protein
LQRTETESSSDDAKPRPRGRRKKYRRWIVLLVVLLGGLVWLNGPGLRWLAPKVARHYFQKAGLRGFFTLEGSLTGGISVRGLQIESDKTLGRLTLKRAIPAYQLKELIKGRIQGIEIDGLHVDLRLGAGTGAEQPADLEKLVQTLRTARSKILPLSISLKDISFTASRDGKPVIALAPSDLHHGAEDSTLTLKLGAITDAKGRKWPAQESMIVWNADVLSIGRIDPLPGVSVRDLMLRLPESGGPSAETEVRIGDAVLSAGASPGFSSVRVDLREGHLQSDQVADAFALKLPAKGALTSLSVNVDGLLPDPNTAIGEARLLLEDVVWKDWVVPELSLDVELQEDRSSLAASGQALGTGFTLNAEVPIAREGGRFQAGDVRGRFNVADVPKLLAALAERTKAIDPEAPVPPSTVDGSFHIALKEQQPAAADVELTLKPADPKTASPIHLQGRWQPEKAFAAVLEVEGVKVKADYRPETFAYQAGMELDNFNSARIEAWLAIVRAKAGGMVSLTGSWNGSGDVKAGTHRGTLAVAKGDWKRESMPPLAASGEIAYDWPGGFVTKDLRLQANDQSVSLDARLADGYLDLANLSWQANKTAVAGGSARLPVPEDFAKWRDTLARDARPLEVSIESKVLSLALLKDWVPAAEKLDPRSTGRVSLKISGSYAKPAIDAVLEAKDLRSPEKPKLPPAELKLTLVGRDGRLSLEGNASAPDFPPAVMTASMPFRPAEWAEDPALIAGEKLDARVDLPRIDISRFSSLVPSVRKASGVLTGDIVVAGEIGKPAIKGKIELTGGGFELKGDRHPPVTGTSATVELDFDRVTLKNLKATIAGGTLQGGGSVAIEHGRAGVLKPGALDFRVTGNHLPLLRNDSIIVRANADLRLTGNWERAALSGTVGVVDSLFYRDIELLPIGTPFTTPSVAALPKVDAPVKAPDSIPEPFRNWTLNVLARTDEPFLIRGNFATGRVDGNVRVGGTIGNPAPKGELKISDFRAALPFSTLTVRSGFLRFDPATGFDPVLEIRGTAEPRPYQVSVFVYGRASDPQMLLTSSPPLPENEIMTLLATGTTTSGLENPQAASSRALQLLVEELRRGRFAVGKQLRPVLKVLDRVDFTLAEEDPYSSESFSTATISITDRWFLSAGMGAEGDSRVLAIWRLTFH